MQTRVLHVGGRGAACRLGCCTLQYPAMALALASCCLEAIPPALRLFT